MFEQAVLPVQDEKTFAEVEKALQDAFAPANAAKFLRQVEKARLRARQFEAILAHGFLGAKTPALYGSLGDSDRGQVRELYLRMIEQVAPELRQKYFRVYAYY
jgi:alkylation response protein AidB-like acyl-CoA dehydrogenase